MKPCLKVLPNGNLFSTCDSKLFHLTRNRVFRGNSVFLILKANKAVDQICHRHWSQNQPIKRWQPLTSGDFFFAPLSSLLHLQSNPQIDQPPNPRKKSINPSPPPPDWPSPNWARSGGRGNCRKHMHFCWRLLKFLEFWSNQTVTYMGRMMIKILPLVSVNVQVTVWVKNAATNHNMKLKDQNYLDLGKFGG